MRPELQARRWTSSSHNHPSSPLLRPRPPSSVFVSRARLPCACACALRLLPLTSDTSSKAWQRSAQATSSPPPPPANPPGTPPPDRHPQEPRTPSPTPAQSCKSVLDPAQRSEPASASTSPIGTSASARRARRTGGAKEKNLPSEPFVEPRLWIIAAAASAPMLRKLEVKTALGWPVGVHFHGDDLYRVGIVVADQLPRDRSTILVRIMAAGPAIALAADCTVGWAPPSDALLMPHVPSRTAQRAVDSPSRSAPHIPCVPAPGSRVEQQTLRIEERSPATR